MAAKKLNLVNFLPYRLSIASKARSSRMAAEYQNRFGLKIPEWRLMAVLGERQPKTQSELVEATRMDKVTVSRAAIALTERGLFQRTPNPHDQRSHLLDLTPSGRAPYRDVAPRALAVETRIFAGFSAEERQTLSRLLARAEAAALAPAGPPGARQGPPPGGDDPRDVPAEVN